MLTRINPLYDISQRLAAVTIEKEFERQVKNAPKLNKNMTFNFSTILADAIDNLAEEIRKEKSDIKQHIAKVGAIALR